MTESHTSEFREETLSGPTATLTNVVYAGHPDHGFQVTSRAIRDIHVDLTGLMRGWPRRVGDNLFIDLGENGLRYLPTVDDLFSWIHESVSICWEDDATDPLTLHPSNPVTEQRFFIYLQNHAQAYASLELLPHFPPIEEPPIYYLESELPAPDMSALNEFMEHVNADSDYDRYLIAAAAMTPGWGGPAGCRPAFMLTSDYGYGVGKTETAKLICELWGGSVELNEKDSWDKIQRAVMNDVAIGRRCIFIDNIKSAFSHGGLESLITANNVGGHLLYKGYRKRPNFYTVFLSANAPQLSRDLTDRCIMLRLGKEQHNTNWKEWSIRFLSDRRLQFISDCLFKLASPPSCEIPPHLLDRWATWERHVLTRFEHGAQMLNYAKQSRLKIDSELQEATSVASIVCNLVTSKGHPDAKSVCVRLSKSELASAVRAARLFGLPLTASNPVFTQRVADLRTMSPLQGLTEVDGEWLWTGPDYQPGPSSPTTDP